MRAPVLGWLGGSGWQGDSRAWLGHTAHQLHKALALGCVGFGKIGGVNESPGSHTPASPGSPARSPRQF